MYLTIIEIITILINHHRNNDCITEILHKQASCCSANWLHATDLWLPVRFLKWDQQSKYRRHHIQFQSNRSHWLVILVYCWRLAVARWFKSESITPSQCSPNLRKCSVIEWLIFVKGVTWYLHMLLWIKKIKIMNFFICCLIVVSEYSTNQLIQYLW